MLKINKKIIVTILILLLSLASITFVLANFDFGVHGPVILITAINGVINNGISPTAGNLTNTTTTRPYFNISISGSNSSYIVNLTFQTHGELINYTNQTIGHNLSYIDGNILSPYGNQTIYANQTLADGLYTYIFNATNYTTYLYGNISTRLSMIIDTSAPNISYQSPTLATVAYTPEKNIMINVTTNDTYITTPSAAQVSGGFVSFELHNGSGLLNRTTFLRNVFTENLIHPQSINITQAKPDDLKDGTYTYNVTVNDSLGNSIILTSRTIIIDTVAPTITVTSSKGTSFELGQATTLTCTVTETNKKSGSLKIIESISETTLCSGASGCSATYTPTGTGGRTASCTADDQLNRSITTTLGLTVTSSGSGGSSGGGGGGGGGSSRTLTTETVAPSTPVNFALSNADIGVDSVSFTTNVQVSGAKVTVTKLTEKPVSITATPTPKVYKYFEVNKQNFENSQIASAKISFIVSKEWLSENKVNKENIILYRFDEKWTAYTPSVKSDTATNVIFEATVPGFSTFAIGIKETTQQEETLQTTDTSTETDTQVGEQTDEQEGNKLAWIIIIIITIFIVLVIWLVKSKNSKGKQYRPGR